MLKDDTNTSSVEIVDRPLGLAKKKKYRQYDVPTEIFRRFQTGRIKFERWKKYLNLQDENQKAIYDYAKRNTNSVIVLRDSETGALRAIRRRAVNEIPKF
tara:strand:- start:376 stop:675 length:300 start_codon:yes stop_codon:yes gene_type:complete